MSLSVNQKERTAELPPISLSGIATSLADDNETSETNREPAEEQIPAPEKKEAAETVSERTPERRNRGQLKKWQGIVLDALLVALVAGVLGSGGYYMKTQWDKYRVPTVMELAQAQCMELCSQREALQDAANHADEQLHMRRMLAHLETKLSNFSEKIAHLRSSITEQQSRVLALQHEIRQADRESRNVARGLLPGLPVGNVSTKRGRLYTNATIARLENKRISVRTPDGAASFPVKELVKDNLPAIVLYALGEIDLVDTSDFTADGSASAASTPTNPKLRKINLEEAAYSNQDYSPPSNGPVVDTNANKTSTRVDDELPEPAVQRGSDDVWQAPVGDLPL